MTDKGTCQKHGEFDLHEGCQECLAERHSGGTGEPPSTIPSTTGIPTPEIIMAEPAPTALISIRPETDITVTSLYAEALTILRYAELREINIADDLKPATDDLSIISKIKKAFEEKRKEYLKPLQEHQQAIRTAFDTLLEPILQADKITRGKILAFQQEQEAKRKEEERINALRLEAARAEMELKGEIREPVDLVEVSPEAPKRVSTDMGTAGLRDNWKWEVLDFALVPDEYKMINPAVLTPAAKSYKDQRRIPGVRIYNEPIIAVNTR